MRSEPVWPTAQRAWSFVEVVIVVVILGIVASIALPRMSRGAAGPDEAGAASDLSILRSAIQLYASEHDSEYPSLARFSEQLILYSDAAGNTSPMRTPVFLYGPYLRAIPLQTVGPNRGVNTITGKKGTAGFGWW